MKQNRTKRNEMKQNETKRAGSEWSHNCGCPAPCPCQGLEDELQLLMHSTAAEVRLIDTDYNPLAPPIGIIETVNPPFVLYILITFDFDCS
jgi:hypothetical protein